MAANILDGRVTAKAVRARVAREVASIKESFRRPGLGVVLVGDDPASHSYVRGKERACEEVGIHSEEIRLSAEVSEKQVLETVKTLNENDRIDGILVQLPLPGHIAERDVLESIAPSKDVDGLHRGSLGALMLGEEGFLPCTPYGVLELLRHYELKTSGKHVVVLGRSTLVGKSLANLLLRRGDYGDATVTVCHSRTNDLPARSREADILVAAMGQPAFVTADMVADGAVVVDVGVSRVEDSTKKKGYRLQGDVDFAAVAEKASWITPVPGGVGPMTITMLLQNTLEAARGHAGLSGS
ncbi:MAG: bifunctional methylenetetrahydrofolate dehydrogenase/methenyltetrahydrofolate cyclohydrolase FolD [Spirochaetales bacterium]